MGFIPPPHRVLPEGTRSAFKLLSWLHFPGEEALNTAMNVLSWMMVLTLAGTEWPQFRGPGARGVSEGERLPERWSTTENVGWKADIPGLGWSSPVVWGDRVFVTTVVRDGDYEPPRKGLYFRGELPEASKDQHHWVVYALDRNSGRILWSREVHAAPAPTGRHVKNTYASETPVTDGKRVYAYFGNVGLWCLDFNGQVLWSERFTPVKTRLDWGTAASPVLHEGRLYVVNDNEEASYLLCLDAETGKRLWRVERDEKSNWSTPYVWSHSLRTEIVTPGSGKVRSYDLQGKLLWEFAGMSSITIATPFSEHGLLYVSSGYVADRNKPSYAIKPGASGDISLKPGENANAFIAWCHRTAAPYNPTPLVYGDYYYVLYDFGFFGCFDARTGKEVYEKQRIKEGGSAAFTSSPWAYGGKIYCLSEDGDTYVIAAGPQYRLLHVNSLDAMCMATPALAGDFLLIRTLTSLYCLRAPAPSP